MGYELGNYYGSAMTFDGNGDYFTADTPVLGIGDWTIEEWFKQEAQRCNLIVHIGVNGDQLEHGASIYHTGTSGSGYVVGSVSYIGRGNAYRLFSGTQDLRDGCWHHVVVEKYNNMVTLYVDGVAKATQADSLDYNSTTDTHIGVSDTGQSN